MVLGLMGEAGAASEEGTAPKTAQAVALGSGSVRVDGRLDEPIWAAAPLASGFYQRHPDEGEPTTQETEIAFLYDDEALYVGARMYCDDPSKIRAIVSRRDNAGSSERLIITLDTYHDRRTSYSFSVTATGVRIDYYHPDDREHARDFSFDPVWQGRTRIDDRGWTAEMRIPFSQLRFHNGDDLVFGLNANRWMPDRNEDSYWIYIPKDETGWASRFGELRGIEGIRPSRRIELLPYFAGDARIASEVDDDDPFAEKVDYSGRVGTDLKLGLGPNLTLDGTVNPDFGQVEADPAEVNLTAFETIFPEKRPFFIEGNQLLQGAGPGYFYSRRIGAPPRGSADGDRVRTPENTTILFASKLTGRLAGGLSVGALGAVTDREYADVQDDSTGERRRVKVEPRTGYGVLRLQQEFGSAPSTAGLTLTGVRRDIESGEDLADDLARRAITGGADGVFYFADKEYMIGWDAGFSLVEGERGAITGIQESSAHYYQRPDANHVDLDTTRTSLTGGRASLRIKRISGRHWLWRLGASAETPGLELNDIGRLHAADDLEAWGMLQYRETEPGRIFRDYSVALFANEEWNFDGQQTGRNMELEFHGTWPNHWSTWAGAWHGPRVKSDKMTRGGPIMETLDTWVTWLGTSNNYASDVKGSINLNYAWDELGAWRIEPSGHVTVRAGGRWEMSVRPRYLRGESARFYFDTIDDGRDETYGSRYVFAWLSRSILSSRFRLNYAFTPDLTLEVYAEPFAASGRYYDHGELAEAGSHDLITYGREGGTSVVENEDGTRTVTFGDATFDLSNENYHLLSFRSNVVLRWEWLPGSTLYLVWQQNREEDPGTGALVGGRDLWDSLRADGENFFAFKVSYWFPLN